MHIPNLFDFFIDLTGHLEWWQVLIIGIDYALKIMALGWVPHDRRPTSAMAWLLAIFLLPFIGLFLFMLMGSPYVNRRRHRIQEEANEAIRSSNSDEPDVPTGSPVSDEIASLVRLNRELTSIPAVDGTLKALHHDPTETIDAMVAAVDKATSYVNCEVYILAWDDVTAPLFHAFERAVQRGVTVRVLWDHVGSASYKGNRKLGKRLTAMGVDWAVMLPLQPWRWRFRRPDLRNHRKILVVDGNVAFMGSQNFIEPGYQKKKLHKQGRHWVDIFAELTGPVVTSINAVFAVDWYTERSEELNVIAPANLKTYLEEHGANTGDELMQIVPSGPGFRTEPNLRLFTSLAHHAKKKLTLVSPYFIPDESLLEAVTTACYRGVEVELYVSEKSDQALVGHAQASYYNELLRAGVKMYLYQRPAVLHSKFAIADDEVAVMGSSNMDMRSFGLNYEISLMAGNGSMLRALKERVAAYKECSSYLTEEEWASRPLIKKYIDNIARLTSALQ